MTERVSPPVAQRTESAAETLLDGLFTGMIGALAVALWFLALDSLAGHPLQTPALLGWVLLKGGGPAPLQVTVEPLPIAAYTAFHFVTFAVVGIALAYLMNVFERFPIMFYVLLVLFLCLQMGFFLVDVALGTQMIGRLRPWTVVVANCLAAAGMAFYQWKRHPSVFKKIERLWEDEPGD